MKLSKLLLKLDASTSIKIKKIIASLYDNKEWDEIIKDAVTDAFKDVEREYEFDGNIEKVEDKARDGFIPYTNGGYIGRGFSNTGYLMGSGNLPTSKKARKAIEDDYERNNEFALEAFKEAHAKEIKDIPEDKLNYNDLYELKRGDLAEKLSELEHDSNDDEQSTIMFELGVFYYEPKGKEDTNNLYVYGVINWEAPYHRSKSNFEDVVYKKDIEFKDTKELKQKLAAELKKAVDKMK